MAIKHVVLFRFKPEIKETQINGFFKELADLIGVVPGLQKFESGKYQSSEGLNQNFTHAFEMIFENEASRDTYLTHPEHEKIKAKIGAALGKFPDDVVAFDYPVQTPPPSPRTVHDGAKELLAQVVKQGNPKEKAVLLSAVNDRLETAKANVKDRTIKSKFWGEANQATAVQLPGAKLEKEIEQTQLEIQALLRTTLKG